MDFASYTGSGDPCLRIRDDTSQMLGECRMQSTRKQSRFQPTESVTVAFMEDDTPLAFGVVKNISEGGACIITDLPLLEDSWLNVRMSFFRYGLLKAGARSVWSKQIAVKDTGVTETHCGIQFTALDAADQRKLREILDSPVFGASAR